MWFVRKKLKVCIVSIILGVSSPCFAEGGLTDFIFMGGPSFSSGKKVGVGLQLGLLKTPEASVGLWPGVLIGGFSGAKSVGYADAVVGLGVGLYNVFFGVGGRVGDVTSTVGQITYGLNLGPTIFAIRRHPGPTDIVTEGVITLVLPIYGFDVW